MRKVVFILIMAAFAPTAIFAASNFSLRVSVRVPKCIKMDTEKEKESVSEADETEFAAAAPRKISDNIETVSKETRRGEIVLVKTTFPK